MQEEQRIAVIFVGNELMLDDGVGPEAYAQMSRIYDVPDNVHLFCAACMSLDMLPYVGDYDVIITVDAIDETGQPAGTVFRYRPDDVAHRQGPMGSLHELRLSDLFEAALLLGYEAEGLCLGVQVENASPAQMQRGLTPPVREAIPRLIETVLAELVSRGCEIRVAETGQIVHPGYRHVMESGD